MRLVLDTNVVVAALRSGSGASAEIIRLSRLGKIVLVGSLPLALEYIEVCARPEHRDIPGMSPSETDIFVLGLCALMQKAPRHWSYRPILKDPNDEMILEAAINGQADAIITFNQRDFKGAEMFGIRVMTPKEFFQKE